MPKLGGASSFNMDGLIDRSSQWRLQWERVERWKRRVDNIRIESCEIEQDFHEVVDVAIAFIQNCYHMRDWLVSTNPSLKAAVEELFLGSLELRAARDVCNGFKHKQLNRFSIDSDPYISRSYDPFAKVLKHGKSSIVYKIYLSNDSEVLEWELFDFVEKCFSQWHSFLSDNKLLP